MNLKIFLKKLDIIKINENKSLKNKIIVLMFDKLI